VNRTWILTVVAVAIAADLPSKARADEVPPPPLITDEGKVLKPGAPKPPTPPPPAPATSPPPAAQTQPAPAQPQPQPQPQTLPTPAPAAAAQPEPEKIKVSTQPAATPETPAPTAAPNNLVALDLARLLDVAAGLSYERVIFEHFRVGVQIRVPFTGTSNTGTEYLTDGVAFTDTAWPWLFVSARYQFVGPNFSGPFVSGAIGVTGMTTMWEQTVAGANIPRTGNNSPVSDCTPAGATSKEYCLTAAGGAVILNGGYSWVLFSHLYLEASGGIEIGFGGTEVNWISPAGEHYTHDFRPPLSLDIALVAGYAF
jgi:hypothetical protein